MKDKSSTIYNFEDKSGKFNRQSSKFRFFIKEEPSSNDNRFPAEANRYHLFVCYTCPWAHRTLIARELKGLQSIISVTFLNSILTEDGWEFNKKNNLDGQGFKYLKQIYLKSDPNYSDRYTVPVLWDKKTEKIVNNESSDIVYMFNFAFNKFSKCNTLDYFPTSRKKDIEQMNTFLYENINNGVYKAGFSKIQTDYENHCKKVFCGLDQIEEILKSNTYLLGEALTQSDIFLLPTIVRFDMVYYNLFKCNLKKIKNYRNIKRWALSMITNHNLQNTFNTKEFKIGYYKGMPNINPNGIVPLGPHSGCFINKNFELLL